ncbi:MAG: FAD-dependent monooxygenase [Candidatus Bathyarchaeota archaeon]
MLTKSKVVGSQKTDVLVIGGEIAGLTMSKYLAEEGIDFILVEEHKDFFMKSCGEGITHSMAGYEFYGIYESKVGIERARYVVYREDPPYVCPICKAKREMFEEIKTRKDVIG